MKFILGILILSASSLAADKTVSFECHSDNLQITGEVTINKKNKLVGTASVLRGNTQEGVELSGSSSTVKVKKKKVKVLKMSVASIDSETMSIIARLDNSNKSTYTYAESIIEKLIVKCRKTN